MENNTEYSSQYSDDNFWTKVKGFAKVAGENVLAPALKLYYAARDPDTPVWATTVVYGALGYFISPIDAIPDITPVVGYTDDLGVLIAATAAIAAHIKEIHKQKAKETLKRWFD
ncbi:YkvA family protein [Vibrio scophthalmi]|uniref:YkvA family protein n=1 Tax=Vibrio scophthalmi TaxID=45658 RepID=UPI003EBFA59A